MSEQVGWWVSEQVGWWVSPCPMLPQYGWTLLTISAEHGHTMVVHKLLTLGASVNTGTEVRCLWRLVLSMTATWV